MDTLGDQLAKLGLVPENKVKEHKAQQLIDQEERQRVAKKGEPEASLRDVEMAKTFNSFKDAAKKLLLTDPQAINRIIRVANGKFSGKDKDSKKLFWILRSFRGELQKAKPDQIERLINRSFRRNNPQPFLPVDE